METIYDHLGEDNLRTMVNRFYDLVQQNSIISPLFKGDIEEIKRKQFMFLTQFFGGPGLYSNEFGHPRMRMRHMPHAITNEAKEEWLKCMKQSISELQIPEELKELVYLRFPAVAQHMVNS